MTDNNATPTDIAAVILAAAVAAIPAVKTVKGLQKFAAGPEDEKANQYGIKNDRGELVTNAYLSRYIQCWCRKGDGYVKDRKVNFAYFMSNEFLAPLTGKTASQVGKIASGDARWDLANNAPKGMLEDKPVEKKTSKKGKKAQLTDMVVNLPTTSVELPAANPTAPVQTVDEALATELNAIV